MKKRKKIWPIPKNDICYLILLHHHMILFNERKNHVQKTIQNILKNFQKKKKSCVQSCRVHESSKT